jgi:hypothetical protein
MRGLDPRIHQSSRKAFLEIDGLPVKPGNDGYRSGMPGFVRQHARIDPDLA